MNVMKPVVLFDFSGTIIDDFEVCYNANVVGLHTVTKKPLSRKLFAELALPITNFLNYFGIKNENDKRTLLGIYQKYYQENLDRVSLFPDVKPALKKLKDKGIKVGIVSQQLRSVILFELKRFGISEFFTDDSIIGFEDSHEQKPSKIPIVTAMKKMGADEADTIFVGDMIQDIQAAKNSNVKSVAIARENGNYKSEVHGSYHTKEMLIAENPDYVFSGLEEFVSNLGNKTS